MAKQNRIGFLGRVPIDTVLVGLLDAVSKGEVVATGLVDGMEQTGIAGKKEEAVSFPLLERYLATTSSKVWTGIAEGVVAAIEKRRSGFSETLQANGTA